jgi:hypothetical protein
LQKSLQRTTVRTEAYTERPSVAKVCNLIIFGICLYIDIQSKTVTPLSTTISPTPIVFTLPTLFPTLPEQTIGPLGIQNIPSIVNGTLGTGNLIGNNLVTLIFRLSVSVCSSSTQSPTPTATNSPARSSCTATK